MTRTDIVAVPGLPQIVITRDFRAPRDLLFRAYTDPELLVQWLGPRTVRMTVDRLDARDGGTWRYVHHQPDGEEHAFHGVYHGTPSPDGIVQTYEYERMPGHVSLNTITSTSAAARRCSARTPCSSRSVTGTATCSPGWRMASAPPWTGSAELLATLITAGHRGA